MIVTAVLVSKVLGGHEVELDDASAWMGYL